jgi:hypothetical protein
VSAFQAFDSTQRFFPGPYSPGKGCVGLPGLNRNFTRFDFTFVCLSKSFTALPIRGFGWLVDRQHVVGVTGYQAPLLRSESQLHQSTSR